MAWGAFWPATTDSSIQDDYFTSELDGGRNEREYAEDNTATAVTAPDYDDVGDDIQTATIYSGIQSDIESLCVAFVDTGVGYDAAGAPASSTDWPFTTGTLRTAASINASGFKRVKPREIANSGSAADTEGAAAANGQFASNQTDGCIYERVAGAWVKRGPPGAYRADRKTLYGAATVGDYLTEDDHVFTEAKAGLDELLWVYCNLVWDAGFEQVTSPETRTGTDSDTVWATAKTATETAYAAAAVAGGATIPKSLTTGQEAAGTFTGVIDVRRVKGQAFRTGTALAWAADLYCVTVAPAGGYNNSTFDDNGLGFTVDDWNLAATVAASTAATKEEWIGNNPNTPYYPTWVAQPAAGDYDARGVEIGADTDGFGVVGLAKFDVASGFTYRP